jgi:hypothetical protein
MGFVAAACSKFISSGPERTSRQALWAAACISLVLAAPLLASRLPMLGDYSNHLARMYVLKEVPGNAALSAIYEVVWGVIPNLAMDLIVPPLSTLVPLETAGRIFIALALLLPLWGVVAVHRSAFGDRGIWPLSAALVTYNGIFFWGFLNFVAGMGLALLATAFYIRNPDRRDGWYLAALVLFGLLLFVCHLQTLALFGVTIGCIELTQLWSLHRGGRLSISAAAQRIVRPAVPMVLPALLFLLASPIGEGVIQKPLAQQIREYYWALHNSWSITKLTALGMPVSSYSPCVDGLATLTLVTIYVLQALRFGCRTHSGLLLAALVFMVGYLFVPSVWLTAANIDSRLPVFAAMLVLAGVAPNGSATRAVRLGAMIFAALIVTRAGIVAYTWHEADRDAAAFRDVVRVVRPGERVLVITGDAEPTRPLLRRLLYAAPQYSFAPLLTIDRHGFWPSLFTSRTLQPVRVRPAYRALSVEQAENPPLSALATPTLRTLSLTPYILNWRSTFDFVLVEGRAERLVALGLTPQVLRLLESNGTYSLYAIQR